MKKTLSLLIAVVLVLGMMSMGASANRGYTYTAPYGTPVIDGAMDDVWTTAEWTQIDYALGDSVISARARILHDAELIYVLAETTDAEIDAKAEFVEFYLDEDNCKDVAYCDVSSQLRINLGGNHATGTNSVGTVEDMLVACEITTSENGYLWEFAVKPMTSVPTDPTQAFGLEFMYDDYDNAGTWVNALRWNVETNDGDSAPYQSVDNFGLLYFAEQVVVEDTAVADDAVVDTTVDAPVTADAGIVVAAVVMAAAAAVVLSKKH